MSDSPSFLILRWSGMGDVVMTLGAVQWLRQHYPESVIWYLTDPAFAPLIEQSGMVDRIVVVGRRHFTNVRRLLPACWNLLRVVATLRRRRFDFIFDLQGFGETALLAWFSGGRQRIGRLKKRGLRSLCYTGAIGADWQNGHRVKYFFDALVDALPVPSSQSVPVPVLPRTRGPAGPPFLVALYIGASKESRRWSTDNFVALADKMDQHGHRIRFMLGPQEKKFRGKLSAVCRDSGWECKYYDQLPLLVADLEECSLLVANDTGPGHVAAALGVPVVTLFSTGDPENVRPYTMGPASWLRNRNINAIAVEDVVIACLTLLP